MPLQPAEHFIFLLQVITVRLPVITRESLKAISMMQDLQVFQVVRQVPSIISEQLAAPLMVM